MCVDILKRFLFGNIIVSAGENILLKHSTIKGKFREADMVQRLEENLLEWKRRYIHILPSRSPETISIKSVKQSKV